MDFVIRFLLGREMTDFYLDFETFGFDPNKDKIITIQYRRLNSKTGKPMGSLTMLKEWESSEREILKEFLDVLNPDDVWDFVPVGYNLRFELFFLQSRMRKVLKYDLSDEWLHYRLPRVDIKSILIMMNKGTFKGATLDWLVHKDLPNTEVPEWYMQKQYQRIEQYTAEKAARFLHALQFLKIRLPQIFEEYIPLD